MRSVLKVALATAAIGAERQLRLGPILRLMTPRSLRATLATIATSTIWRPVGDRVRWLLRRRNYAFREIRVILETTLTCWRRSICC